MADEPVVSTAPEVGNAEPLKQETTPNIPKTSSEELYEQKKEEYLKQQAPEGQGTESEPEKPKFSEEMLGIAANMGFTTEELEAFSNDAELENTIKLMESKILSIGKGEMERQRASQTNVPQERSKTPDQNPPAQTNTQQAAQAVASAIEELKIELDANEYDPTIVKAFKDVEKTLNTLLKRPNPGPQVDPEIDQMKGMMNRFFQEQEQQKQIEFANKADSKFIETIEKNKEFAKVFGEGDRSKLKPDSKEFKNRIELLETIDALEAGYLKLGKQVPSFDIMFRSALNAKFNDDLKKQARKEITDSLNKNKKMFTNRPTQRSSVESPNSVEKAIKFAEQFRQEKGLTP